MPGSASLMTCYKINMKYPVMIFDSLEFAWDCWFVVRGTCKKRLHSIKN